MLRERIEQVEDRIRSACERAGRRREEVTLLAVTKIFPASAIREAYALGLREFGENYVQEFEGKSPAVAGLEGARFHLIGHLQINKSKAARGAVRRHPDGGFRASLARRLSEAPERRANPLDVLLEVKLSPEQAKSGAGPEELPALIAAVRACPSLRLLGLMTMPPWSDDPEPSRPYFRRLHELAERHGLAAALDGHVARSGSCHRRRRDLRARGHGAVRQAQIKAVKVGYSSPLPPARTGVADYCRALLAALRRAWRCPLNTTRTRTYALYHLGNNQTPPRDLPAALRRAGGGRCCTTPSAPLFPGLARPRRRTSTSSSTITASGIAATGGGSVARHAGGPCRIRAISSTPCCGALRNARAPWWCTTRPRRAPWSASTAPAHGWSRSRICSPRRAAARRRSCSHARERQGLQRMNVSLRRVRLPARIEAAHRRPARV